MQGTVVTLGPSWIFRCFVYRVGVRSGVCFRLHAATGGAGAGRWPTVGIHLLPSAVSRQAVRSLGRPDFRSLLKSPRWAPKRVLPHTICCEFGRGEAVRCDPRPLTGDRIGRGGGGAAADTGWCAVGPHRQIELEKISLSKTPLRHPAPAAGWPHRWPSATTNTRRGLLGHQSEQAGPSTAGGSPSLRLSPEPLSNLIESRAARVHSLRPGGSCRGLRASLGSPTRTGNSDHIQR